MPTAVLKSVNDTHPERIRCGTALCRICPGGKREKFSGAPDFPVASDHITAMKLRQGSGDCRHTLDMWDQGGNEALAELCPGDTPHLAVRLC